MQVIALRDIVAGEEVGGLNSHKENEKLMLWQVLTAYIDTTLPKALRQASLRETYLFSCACALCTSAAPVDPRESVWCPKACGGMCPTPTEGKSCPPPVLSLADHGFLFSSSPFLIVENSLSQCTKCRAVLQKTDEVLDAVRIGQQALDKATLLQFSDPAKSKQLSSKLVPILASAGATPSSHPLLALTRLHTALLIADLHHPQSQSQSDAPTTPTPTPTEAQAALDEAVVAATKAVAGLEDILRYGHPVRGIARAELGRLLAVDEPAPRAPGTAAEEALRYPPSGVKRLRLALETLVSARGELGVGFGAPNEGGVVGRTVRDDIVRLERELAVWKKGLGEALRDAKEAKTGLS
jgi:SET and MYND domain-containing protein